MWVKEHGINFHFAKLFDIANYNVKAILLGFKYVVSLKKSKMMFDKSL